MQVAVERRPGSVAALTITVEPHEVDEQVEKLFQKHARRVNIPGFRPGKAPRKLLEERIPPESLRMEAVEDLIDITYKAALQEQEIEPLERGEIEELKPQDDNSVIFTVVVPVRPEVTLPDYSTLSVTHEATKVQDEEVDAQLGQYREHTAEYQEIADEPIETGDYVTIDYTMTVDGEAYPDGGTEGYPLEVGTDTFFPELNEALVGKKVGEPFPLTVTYAEDYSNKELAGKTAEFTITIQQARRRAIPALDDAWAQMITGGQAQTVDALRDIVRENMKRSAAESDREAVRSALIDQLVSASTLDVPETLVDAEYEHLMQRLEHQLTHEHLTLEEYAEYINSSVEDIQQERRIMARDYVRRSLVLQEVARREKILVTDDEVNTLIQAYALSRGAATGPMKPNDVRKLRKDLEKSGQLDHLASRLFHEKVISFLEGQAQITIEGAEEPAEEPVPEAAPDAETAVTGADDAPAATEPEAAAETEEKAGE